MNKKSNREDGDIPVMISTSSFVIAAWRPRLYFICRLPIMSEAFLEALSMALRLKRGRCEQNKRYKSRNVGIFTEHSVRKRDLP